MEEKQKILDHLLLALRQTRNQADLEELTYEPLTETVYCRFETGAARRVNVAADSGTAMIRDVMSVLG